jgi:hypothetical protein
VKVTKGKGNDTVDKNDVLKITGDYEVKDGASITIKDADGTQATFTDDVNAKITEENGDIRIEVTKEPVTVPSDDSDTKKARTLNIDNLTAVTSTDVQRAGANNDGGGGGDGDGGGGGRDGGGDGGGGGGNPTNPVTPAQDTTTPTTTNDTTITDSDPILEDTTSDDAINAGESVRDEGSFRCDFFLRTVRDENGALRAQYRDGDRDDELIVQRFEQCLSEEVLADTIPDRNLPFTGGVSLPSGGGLILLVAAMILAGG